MSAPIWSEHDAMRHVQAVTAKGWLRVRPASMGLLLIGSGVSQFAPTRDQLAAYARNGANPRGELSGTCWPPPPGGEPEAEESSSRRGTVADHAARYGIEVPESVDDLIELMVSAGILVEACDELGTPRLRPRKPLPDLDDIFPLDEEERLTIDSLKSAELYAGKVQLISGMIPSESRRKTGMSTSISQLSEAIGETHDGTRRALLLLLEDGDVFSSVDISKVAVRTVFHLHRDWSMFHQKRIGLTRLDEV
ncbi:DUF6042 family protein [Kitasatospora phosalacinea]|nr:DUF6042 family protein [Kitasatospora phosalacinea]